MENLSKDFWNERYIQKTTQWDLGKVSPPLKNYIDQIIDKNLSILIPGCGNAYEAAYLIEQGFSNITIIDIAPELVQQLQIKYQAYSQIRIIEANFFEHNGNYDLIIEQTFFCAIYKSLRFEYAKKMYQLLNKKGKLMGVLFNKEFENAGPPFGGSKAEYESYFSPYFSLKIFDTCFNSHPKRAGNELFLIAEKKKSTSVT